MTGLIQTHQNLQIDCIVIFVHTSLKFNNPNTLVCYNSRLYVVDLYIVLDKSSGVRSTFCDGRSIALWSDKLQVVTKYLFSSLLTSNAEVLDFVLIYTLHCSRGVTTIGAVRAVTPLFFW